MNTRPRIAGISIAQWLAVALLAALPATTAWGQEKPDGKKGEHDIADRTSVTEHETSARGQTIRYRATAGTLVLKGDDDKPKASVFYVAYERLAPNAGPATKPATDQAKEKAPPAAQTLADADPAKRPITYVFNGGPGAAAVWLHLGTAGPKRVKLTEHGDGPPPPYGVEDNGDTWLDATDLVFIDPVGTGYSRPAPGEKQEQFSGVREDIQWVAEFIRLYTARNHRWGSPKFLAGESYGTTRAAGLSDYLLDRHGIALNGIVFISTVLNFQTLSFAPGNDLPYALYLPSYTAIAVYHKKAAPELMADESKALKEAERWAMDGYLPALAKGSALPADERKDVIQKLRRFTGLPADVIDKADLRISPDLFRATLLEDKREVLGRFDARISGYNTDPLSHHADFDPSLGQYLAAYSSAFGQYVRAGLKFESDQPYEVLSGRVGPWNFGRAGNGYLNVSDDLQDAMRKNPHLKVLFANGLNDLATPYFATVYTAGHLDLSPALRQNVAETFYPGGHMLYHYAPSRAALHDDVRGFIEAATGGK